MTVATYFQPASVPEALELLAQHGAELLVMAGGTVAMPLINEGISLPRHVMTLRRAGLDTLAVHGDVLEIGAAVTLTRLLEEAPVPLLREAAGRTASWSIRNMATVGGNLFTPPPGGDVAVALLALDATVRLTGLDGVRDVPLGAFLTGFMATDLRPGELVTSIQVPLAAGDGTGETAFVKFGRKAANTPAVVTVAVRLQRDGDRGTVTNARIALGAAGPHPMRSAGAEAAIVGTRLEPDAVRAAAVAAVEDSEAFTDAVASDWYRQRMVGVFVARALDQLAGRAGGEGA